jgi:uncharacterized protein (DUF1697 family)
MRTHVALLRGINVGKGKRVPMAELRRVLESLGFTDVATLLNSGNVVFTTAAKSPASRLAGDIAAAITARLDVQVPVQVKSSKDFTAVIRENPFGEVPNASRLLVALAPDARTLARLATLAPLAGKAEQFHVGRHAAWLHCPQGILQSPVGKALLGKVGEAITTRNWVTCVRIHALLRDA